MTLDFMAAFEMVVVAVFFVYGLCMFHIARTASPRTPSTKR